MSTILRFTYGEDALYCTFPIRLTRFGQLERCALAGSRLKPVLTPIGGGLLGLVLASIVLMWLAWVTLDPCAKDEPIPLSMLVFLLSAGALLGGAFAHVFEPGWKLLFGANLVAVAGATALWIALLAHASHAALDCTWILHPAVGGG